LEFSYKKFIILKLGFKMSFLLLILFFAVLKSSLTLTCK
jgi:hypothetical protein